MHQIMQACHWKAHNTLTNFYLKDLTLSDNDNNMYLGPVVAAQQVLDPFPQHPHLQEEKKGGGARQLHPSFQESFPGSRYQLPFKMFTARSFYPLFLCQLTCQSADMSSLCGVGVRVRVNNFFSKTTRPRDLLFF